MRTTTLLLGLLLAGSACGDGNSPTRGTLTIQLTSASSQAGAIMLTVHGGPILDVSAPAGYHVYDGKLSQSSHRIMITGSIISGELASITVPDIKKAASYQADVVQVAAPVTAPVAYAQLQNSGFVVDIQE
jgi:hypothetical protein